MKRPVQATEMQDRSLKPLLAFLASFAGLALGYVYVGRLRQAFFFIAVVMATISLASWSRIVLTPTGFYITAASLIMIAIVPMVHCPMIALRERTSTRKKYNTWWAYVGWIIASIFCSQALLELRPTVFGYDNYELPSQSMFPTLQQGDYIIVDTWVFGKTGPKVGDLVVFDIGDAAGTMYVKRIVGLPGDSLEIRDATLFRNGAAVDEPYLAVVDSAAGMGKEVEAITLGESQYFVLGDNRTRSKDSRYLGPVPAQRLHGVARLRWFSYDDGARWERFPFVFE